MTSLTPVLAPTLVFGAAAALPLSTEPRVPDPVGKPTGKRNSRSAIVHLTASRRLALPS